ncbi:hypothetical protein SAMN03159343_0126 [Klenkia marina]|uniref:Uncharacterized protein n=1 Tax=Klenkia marina TaxID=1960309 RepID=A0A1G4XA51_9ACTN|nr:hypothetical protein [Klenkia marina]SCX37528.1 hypothetical protein SAMN03159343_0126 [Klenkia marina]
MRFVQGLLLGVSAGCLVGAAADVLRSYSLVGAVLAFVLFAVLSGRGSAGRQDAARRRTDARLRATRARLQPDTPSTPGGFFAGRRLGDALAWLAAEHAISTLERVGVTEDDLVVLFPGPQGPRLAVVHEAGSGFEVGFVDEPADPRALLGGTGRFQARDLAPDVLPRVLERARRDHPDTWTHVQDPEAVLHRPDRLRDDVTVQLHNGAPTGADQTVWASGSGDLLYVQESLS